MLATTNYCAIKSKYGYSEFKYPRLSELYNKLFEADMEKAHDSKYDVINLAKCFFKILHDTGIQKIGKKRKLEFISN